jgi:hypothetical protein
MSDEIVTILRTVGNHRAQKVFINGQALRPYNAGMRFTFERKPVSGLQGFAVMLAEIERDPTAFIIRGQPLPHLQAGSEVFRRCKGEGAAFAGSLTRLACIDVDHCVGI